MTRREELKEVFKDVNENEKTLIKPLIDEVIFLEAYMNDLKNYPFISVNPKNQAQQKKTEAAKLYKECSQSYMNAIRILCSLIHKDDGNEESPLREYLNSLGSKYE